MHNKNYYLEKDFLMVYGPDTIVPEDSKSAILPGYVLEINLNRNPPQ